MRFPFRFLFLCLLGAFSASAQVLVNQSGYNLDRPKRFTAPLAGDGTVFTLTREGGTEVLFSGTVSGGVGDFSDFRPLDDPGPYVARVEGHSTSFPFGIGDAWIERVGYQRAVDFMIDARRDFGFLPEPPTDGSIDHLLPSSLGIAWRDSHQFSFELSSLISMYCANPGAFHTRRMRVQGTYENLRHPLPDDTPEIVRLIYWGVDIYLRSDVNHTLLKEQLAWFLYYYPAYSEYIPLEVYEVVRDTLFPIWDDSARDRFNWYDISHDANLLQVFTQIGSGKGSFPPGHSILPNLMMYEVALRENLPNPAQYFTAAYNQTDWIIQNLDLTDPATTKGQRMSEHVLMEGLAVFRLRYPDLAPPGLTAKIEQWVDIMIARSDNLWDFRKYSDTVWTIPSYNEPGNVAGFPACAYPARLALTDVPRRTALERIATAQIDNMFGRNPLNRHFSYDAADPDAGFEGVEQGWPTYFNGGVGQLQDARGVLDGSPKNTAYPYNPSDDPGYTEGWVSFNAAWNAALAWMSVDASQLRILEADTDTEPPLLVPGRFYRVELTAPLNFNYDSREAAAVRILSGNSSTEIAVLETARNTGIFQGEFVLDDDPAGGDTVSAIYGWGFLATTATLPVNRTSLEIATPSIPSAALNQELEPFAMDAVNAAGSVTWSVSAGSLPPGISFHPGTGELSGIPSATGTSVFTLRAADGTGTVEQAFTLTVESKNRIPRIRNAHVPPATSGDPYAVRLEAVDGNGPSRWSVISGALPTGLTLSGPGWIDGVPTVPGEYTFTVRAADSDGDAGERDLVLIVQEHGQHHVVDDEAATGVTVVGAWTFSSHDPGYNGSGYRHDQDAGKGSKEIRFHSDLDGAFRADVYLRWTESNNRASNTPVDIHHADGTATILVDQRINGAVWNYLGRWDFDATGAEVVVRTTGTNGYVVADAVRFVTAEPSRYRLFQEAFFPLGRLDPNAGPDQDPDGDGRKNLLEYADHTDPTVFDAVDASVGISLGPGGPVYTVPHDDTLDEIRTTVEYTTDLNIPWTPLTLLDHSRRVSPDRLLRDIAPLPDLPVLFLRKSVELHP